jgi:uncharacterized membrane protein YcfT
VALLLLEEKEFCMKRKIILFAFCVEFIALIILVTAFTYVTARNPESVLERWIYIGGLIFFCCNIGAMVVWSRYRRKHLSQ